MTEAPLSVRRFLEAGREELALRLVAGEAHLDRAIAEHAPNRPGLALSGFLRYFAHRRIQVLGLAETTYLKSLPLAEQARRLEGFLAAHVPCVVLARGLRAPPLLLERAAAAHTPVLRTRLITGEFLQRAAVLIEELVAPRTRVQGTMVDIQGIGVLIEGPAGIGKSETALGLIARGSSLVADDVTELRRDAAGGLRASAVPATRYHMELRGLGIIHVPSLLGVASVRREKRLDLIVRLEPAADGGARESTEPAARELLGVAVPCVALPVAAGRDPVHLVHLAALNFRLRQLGHDAAKELDQRLVQMLERGGRRTSD